MLIKKTPFKALLALLALFSHTLKAQELSLPEIESLIEQMTLEEKVGQLLMVHFNGASSNQEAEKLIKEISVGGIIYYNWTNKLSSPSQVQSLSLSLQSLAKTTHQAIPLLIATDQEGGRVTRLQWTSFPPNQVIGMSKNRELAKDNAFLIGKELKSVGINMNLAPVIDIDSEKGVLGDRCFGSDVETVISCGEKALAGYRQACVIATLKHYPGYRSATLDPHAYLPISLGSLEELEAFDLLPFIALAPQAEAIMTAHLLIPAFDEKNCSTLSFKTLSYLREKIGFDGVIISDSLAMEGAQQEGQTIEAIALLALNAGCDILLLGGRALSSKNETSELTLSDIERIHESIVSASRRGALSQKRLNKAVFRILRLKKRFLDWKKGHQFTSST